MKELIALGHWMQQPQKQEDSNRKVLFVGPTTVAKAAADDLAKQANRPLMIVPVAPLVSRYISETEKKLDAIFRKAAAAKAVLFFDEADALFGKRSAIQDAHDRYANAKVSHLLKRMETYPWPSILSVQKKHNLDEAFMRRFQHTIRFPLV